MGKSESFEFQDMSKDSSMNDVHVGSKKTGCYVSIVTGFVLTLLAACLAVGVGLIVHFATAGGTIDCKCSYPGYSGGATGAAVGSGGTTTSNPATTQKPVLEQCKDLVNSGNKEICDLCTATSPATPDVTTTKSASTTPPNVIRNVRLPLNLYPTLYDVELQPQMYSGNPKEFFFNGSVRIEMMCMHSTHEIVLHTNKLNISKSSIVIQPLGTNEASIFKDVEFDTVNQFLILKTSQQMAAGANFSVEMTFYGPLIDDLAGLYLSSYDRGNDTIYIATSQMQPTDARKTFPCFDEPAIKAKFKATLVRKSHMVTLSNTPIETKETRGDGWIADHYMMTPKMSTYLLAFIVCDFNYTVNVTKNNVTYRAWATPEAVDQTPYSLQVGVDVLTYFEDYFNISFPLPKMDMIAVPDFAAGAMENWGLIIYRETAMLYDPMDSAESNKQRVAVVVSHELAHQWFGNLVTPSWWDDLWLNEGFASFVEYMGVDHVHPDWLMFEQFVVEDVQDVFNMDGLVTSHPVYVPVSHPNQINELFDRISYAKGASIIRMMRFFLGEETFRRGLERYLKEKAYDAAFHDDLWYALGNQSIHDGKPLRVHNVKHIMDTWTLQMNFPTVTMTKEGMNVRLRQSRYLLDPTATDPGTYVSPFGYKWEIPFTFTTNTSLIFNQTDADIIWMGRNGSDVVLPRVLSETSNEWYIGNMMQYGFYRVNYPEENWNNLIYQLKADHKMIHPINRAQIINDAWNLAKSGDLKMDIALQTVEYLANEDNYLPYSAALSELSYVDDMLERTELYGAFSKFMKTTFTKPFDKFGMDNSGASHLEIYVRKFVVSQACKYGNSECIGNATKLFKQLMDNPPNAVNPVDVNLRSTVYCNAIRNGGIDEWDFAYQKYKTSNVATEKAVLLLALSCSRDVWVLSRYLTYTLTTTEIRKQDAVNTIVYISRNPIGRSLAWDFVRSKWDFIFNEYGGGAFSFSRLIIGITSSFNTNFDLQMITDFVAGHPELGSGARAFQQAIERTRNNIHWMNSNYMPIESWLNRIQG